MQTYTLCAYKHPVCIQTPYVQTITRYTTTPHKVYDENASPLLEKNQDAADMLCVQAGQHASAAPIPAGSAPDNMGLGENRGPGRRLASEEGGPVQDVVCFKVGLWGGGAMVNGVFKQSHVCVLGNGRTCISIQHVFLLQQHMVVPTTTIPPPHHHTPPHLHTTHRVLTPLASVLQ